jgi:hypothetical protein
VFSSFLGPMCIQFLFGLVFSYIDKFVFSFFFYHFAFSSLLAQFAFSSFLGSISVQFFD